MTLNEQGVQWKNIIAEKIIFCDGLNTMNNPYFKALPFVPNKGEALIVEIKDLPNQAIYKNNMTIVPWKDQLFWVGSNYDWEFTDTKPSIDFRNKMEMALRQLLKIPFNVVDHIAGIRPAECYRTNFCGKQPERCPERGQCQSRGILCSHADDQSRNQCSYDF